jgi:hypothetical protein
MNDLSGIGKIQKSIRFRKLQIITDKQKGLRGLYIGFSDRETFNIDI